MVMPGGQAKRRQVRTSRQQALEEVDPTRNANECTKLSARPFRSAAIHGDKRL